MQHEDRHLGQRLGPFILEQRLGDHGSVYHAVDVEQRRSVAVQLLPALPAPDDRAIQAFLRELSYLHTLRHPHLVRCLGGGVQELQPFIAWELMRGDSLAHHLRRQGPLRWDVAVTVTQQVCAALAYAADNRNVLHLRLSPHKILFTEEGMVKVTGFRSPAGDAGPSQTDDRTVESLAYRAPEQICGRPEVSQKTDLYSLGCILFEMLTGRPPFSADTPLELAQKQLATEPPRIAMLLMDCPIWLDTLVAQLLEKLPDRRPHFASSVALALEETMEKVRSGVSAAEHALSGRPTAIRAPRPDTEVQQLVAPKRKRRPQGPFYERLWFLLSCLALLIGVVAWAVWPPGEEKLFAEAQILMESGDLNQWEVARREYLEPLLRRFPDGLYAAQAQEYIDQIDMAEAEERMRRTKLLDRSPSSEGERRYLEAREYEDFGDLATALQRYQQLIDTLPATEKDRGFPKLAKRQVNGIRSRSTLPTPEEFLRTKLEELDQLLADGEDRMARRLVSRIKRLYQDDAALAPLVEEAQAKLADKERPDSKEPPRKKNGEP